MSIEKRGVIDEQTPDTSPKPCCGGGCKPKTQIKEAADRVDETLPTRMSDAAADAFREVQGKK